MLLKLCKRCNNIRDQLIVRPLIVMKRCERNIFGFGKKSKKESEEDPKELLASHAVEEEIGLGEEEVMRMRDKSRLPGFIRSEITLKDIPEIRFLWEYRKEKIRKRYATYGKASGLKPGIMWPSKEELQYLKGYEQVFHRPLHEMVSKVKAIREEEIQLKQKREKEVLNNLKQLPKWKQEFWAKHNKMNADIEAEKLKKEKLIQEVREFVGYDLDPKDPRFEEALLKKDEETKKLSKALRKQEKQKQTLEKLQSLAAEAMEREKDEQSILEKSKTIKQKDQQSVDSNVSKSSADSDNK